MRFGNAVRLLAAISVAFHAAADVDTASPAATMSDERHPSHLRARELNWKDGVTSEKLGPTTFALSWPCSGNGGFRPNFNYDVVFIAKASNGNPKDNPDITYQFYTGEGGTCTHLRSFECGTDYRWVVKRGAGKVSDVESFTTDPCSTSRPTVSPTESPSQSPTSSGCDDLCPLGGEADLRAGECTVSPPIGTVAVIDNGVWSYLPFPSKDFDPNTVLDSIWVCPTIEDQVIQPWKVTGEAIGDCLVGTAPEAGGIPFIRDDAFYYEPVDGATTEEEKCPDSLFPSSSLVLLSAVEACFVADIPEGYYGFISGQKFLTKFLYICGAYPLFGFPPDVQGNFDGTDCHLWDEADIGQLNGIVRDNEYVYSLCPSLDTCADPCPVGGDFDLGLQTCTIPAPERTIATIEDGVWSYSPFPDPLFGAPFGFNPFCPTIEGESLAARFDGNFCLVGTAPDGPYQFVPPGPVRPFRFVFEGAFYYLPVNDPGNGPCPYAPYDASRLVQLVDDIGSFDACLVAEIPEGFDGFIDGLQFRTGHSHVCPQVDTDPPRDGAFDGTKCVIWNDSELEYDLNGYVEGNSFVYSSCPPLNRPSARWYPSWASGDSTCLNDGNQSLEIVNLGLVYSSLDSCCTQHYSWVYEACMGEGGEPVGHTNKYFSDYGSGSCLQDCPPGPDRCATVPPPVNLYDSIESCCSIGQQWVDYLFCTSRSVDEYTYGWVVHWAHEKCVKDCDPLEGLPCADPKHEDQSAQIYATPEECCARLNWLDQDACVADSQNKLEGGDFYTNKFYVDWMNIKCARDCDLSDGPPCMGNPPDSSVQLFEDVQSCCSEKLQWVNAEQCLADTFGISTQTSGTGEWYVDWSIEGPGGTKEGKCVQSCGIDQDSPLSCGGLMPQWSPGYPSASACCASIHWVPADRCHL
ncbi:hypothetical protein ACHAXR_008330 [Thalassiosira sp. AJA248-18]